VVSVCRYHVKIIRSLRDYKFVARLAEVELLIWLTDTNPAVSAIVFARIIAALSITPEPITVSIGTCHFRFVNKKLADLGKLVEALITKADKALDEAKHRGRNHFFGHSESITN
jgi:GGDEF domain-containing protein